MTQIEYDDKVLALASKHITLMGISADLRNQGDSEAQRLEEEQMFLQNIISALKDYDVTSDLLTSADIEYLFELGTGACISYP